MSTEALCWFTGAAHAFAFFPMSRKVREADKRDEGEAPRRVLTPLMSEAHGRRVSALLNRALSEWRHNAWRVYAVCFAVINGLILLAAKQMERTQ